MLDLVYINLTLSLITSREVLVFTLCRIISNIIRDILKLELAQNKTSSGWQD